MPRSRAVPVRAVALGALALLTAVTACSDDGGSDDAADATTTTGSGGSTVPTSLPPVGTDPVATTSTTLAPAPTTLAPPPSVDPLPPLVTAPPEISAGCLDGQWYVVGSDGGSADVTGIVGVQLSISKLEWALSASDALATVGSEDITFDGTASGTPRTRKAPASAPATIQPLHRSRAATAASTAAVDTATATSSPNAAEW